MKLNEDKNAELKKSENAVDIKRLADFQLLEIYERQSKIMKNKNLLYKLPDKGKKIIEKNKQIEDELELRKKTTDDIITSISELSIGTKVKDKELNAEKKNTSVSSSCSSLSHEGSSAVEVPMNDGTPSTTRVDRFAYQRSDRLDHVTAAQRFIPSHSAKVKEPSNKEYEDKDLSAACLPRGKFDVVQVSLTEVVKLKGRETVYLKELEIKEAQEMLTSLEFGSTTLVPGATLSSSPMSYRAPPDQDSSDEENEETPVLDEETPVLDEDEDDRVGTVSFTVQE